MATISEEMKLDIFMQLHKGVPSAEVARVTETSYSSVLRMKNEMDTALLEGNLHKLLKVDEAIVNTLAGDITLPLDDAIKGVTSGIDGLHKLNLQMQNTASGILTQINKRVLYADESADILKLADSVSKLQQAFFNSNATSINIQNNNGGGDGEVGYSEFLGDAPGGS